MVTTSTSGDALVAPNAPPTVVPLLAPGTDPFKPIVAPTFAPTVPTTAPKGQTSVTAPPSTSIPTAVVSSQPAKAAVTQMQNTAQTAQQETLAQMQKKQANAGQPGFDVFGNPVAGTPLPTGGAAAPVPGTPAPTPEQQIADTPDAGYKWAYKADGTRLQIPLNSTASQFGYVDTNPTVAPTLPVTDSATDPVGNTYKQFSDGTYGKFDASGAYQGVATQGDFQATKTGNGYLDSINKVLNGTYPLTVDQQAQVDNLKTLFAEMVEQQKVANANLTGGTTVAENLYGMGNSITGMGEIKGTIDSGIQKIADINAKMVSSVSDMMAGFKSDNLKLLTTAYNIYTDLAKNRQDELDKINDATTKKADSLRSYNLQVQQLAQSKNDAIDNDIRTVMEEAQKGNASPEQITAMQQALNAHDYAAAVQAAGDTLQDPTSPAGQYSAYVKTQKAAGKPAMSAGDFLAAQKYKEAYAAASASASAQSAFTESDKNQAKLEHQLQQAALSSRSDLGIQNKKVSVAIDLRAMLNQFKDKDGNYNVPATNYTELALGLATLLSPTGVPAQSVVENLQQPTAKGSLNAALTYATGTQWNGTTQDVLKTLSESIDRQGQTSEVLRNQELQAQTPTDLDTSRVEHVVNSLPSYDKMSNGSIAYQSPEQIANTAKTSVQSFVTNDPSKAPMIQDLLKIPGANYVTIAQKLNLLPSQ